MNKHKNMLTWVVSILFIIATIVATTALVGYLRKAQKLRDARAIIWNEVSYPQGNVGEVVPDEVRPGDTIAVTFKEFCNKGVDTTLTRWIDFYSQSDPEMIIGAYGLTDLEFFGSRMPGGCFAPLVQNVTLPDELAGRPAGKTVVRLRIVTTYTKPEQVINVESYSEKFILLP